MGGRGRKDLKARVDDSAALAKQMARLNSEGIQAGGVRGESHSVGKCWTLKRSRDAAGGQLLE